MPGLLERFRDKIIDAGAQEPQPKDTVDNLIALGVLLWEVAQADDKFLPEERAKVGEVLATYGKIMAKDMPIVLRAVEEASLERIDLYSFTSEVGGNLSFKAKTGILENLFRVACADGDLGHEEQEMIRKIAGLLRVDHAGFIDAKLKVKKEFGLDTAGL
jgi:uncharacterized tellurite resistance protein B-like protein